MGRSALLIYAMVAAGLIGQRVVAPATFGGHATIVVLALAVAGFSIGMARNRPAEPAPWRWLQAGLALGLIAMLVGRMVPLDGLWSPAPRLLQVLAYVTAAVGVWLIARSPTRNDTVDQWLASVLVVTAGSLVAFVFIVQPSWRIDALAGPGASLRATLPVFSLGLAAVLVRSTSCRASRPAPLLVAAGFLTFVLADAVPLLGLAGLAEVGQPSTLRLIAPLLVGAAPLHPSIRRWRHDDGEVAGHLLNRGELIAILLAGVSGPISLVLRLDAATRTELAVIGIGSAVLVTLVLARLWRLLVALGEASRREYEARFRSLVENTEDVVCVADPAGHVTYVSPTCERVWGYPIEEMAASGFGMIADGDRERLREVFRHVATGPAGTTVTVEGRARHGDGSARRFEAVYANRIDDPAIGGVVMTSRDVTDRHELEQRLWRQAFVDELTGLPNRARLLDRLETALASADEDRQPVLIVLGIDEFKTINDSLGPQRGDELIRTVAQRLQLGEAEGAIVARVGGDQFALLLSVPVGSGEGETTALRALAAVARPVMLAGRRLEPKASCGVAVGVRGLGAAELLRDAEAAMHVAKAEERGGYRIFDPDMHAAAVRRMQLQMDLALAVEHRQLWVAYQPIHEIRTGRMAGVEALLRWDHPLRGAVPPNEFIPLAETTGRIAELGEFVLRRACLDIAELRARTGADLTLSVNLSPAQLADPALTCMVAAALADSGLPAPRLTLEVTEGVFLERSQNVIEALRGLREIGVRLAIDDFGTGYCALGYLTSFWFDVVKIDRSFIRVLDGAEDGDRRVTLGILELVGKLEVPAVAEGIETEGQLDELRAVGCEFGQGFHWSRPVPIDQLIVPVSATRRAALDPALYAETADVPPSHTST